MKYRRYVNGVETVYAYSNIERSYYAAGEYDPTVDQNCSGSFTFLSRFGRTFAYPVPTDWSYGSFHGLTLSMDGTKFFLQGWENGIRCFDLTNGRLVWKNRIRRTRNLLVSENTLVAVTGDRKLIAMSVDTGLVTAERTGFRQVIDVTEKLCMAVDREKRCFLVDKDTLEIRLTLPGKLHKDWIANTMKMCYNVLQIDKC